MRRVLGIASALLLCGCGGDSSERGAGKPRERAFTPIADAPPKPIGRYRIAQVTRRTQLRTEPHGRVVATVGPRTEFRSKRVLGVLGQRDGWLKVTAAELPNHRPGWIPADAAQVGRTNVSLVVDLSTRRMTLLSGRRVLRRYTVAIGRPENPTPPGRYTVTDHLRPQDPSSPYGCCAIGLSGHQTRLVPGWPGGDRLAIHGTPAEWSIGEAVSLGCVRMRNTHIRGLMRLVPLGAPVFIRA